jgi:hypothetical protein
VEVLISDWYPVDRDSKYSERETAWQNIVNDLHPAVVITNSYKDGQIRDWDILDCRTSRSRPYGGKCIPLPIVFLLLRC